MKIVWHSNSPGTPGGYGGQTRIAARILREAGHEVALSCFNLGPPGANLGSRWDGFPVLPGGYKVYGNGIVTEHARRFEADWIWTLIDVWTMDPEQFRDQNLVVWLPCDTEPLSAMDKMWLSNVSAIAQNLVIAAMSRHGQKMLDADGFSSFYVPHSIDTGLFRPAEDRAALREKQGIPDDMFLVCMIADNKGKRKAQGAQLEGFAKFALKHPDAGLYCHCDPRPRQDQGYDMMAMVARLGLEGRIQFPDPYAIETALYPESYMAEVYAGADVCLGASMGEGFGLPIIESQACGTPSIVTRASAMTELVPASCGWTVRGLRYWIDDHRSWWVWPDSDDICRRLERAHTVARTMRGAARQHALKYDCRAVAKEHWPPLLAHLESLTPATP